MELEQLAGFIETDKGSGYGWFTHPEFGRITYFTDAPGIEERLWQRECEAQMEEIRHLIEREETKLFDPNSRFERRFRQWDELEGAKVRTLGRAVDKIPSNARRL